MQYTKWTSKEEQLLRSAYDHVNNRAIDLPKELLKTRSRIQCRLKAAYLGIARKRDHGFNAAWNKHLTPEDWSYLAGIIDGEGYILVYPKIGYFAVGVGSTSYELLVWLQAKIGGRIQKRKRAEKIHGGLRKQAWEWKLSGKQTIVPFLKLLAPKLIIKKQKALESISIIEKLFKAL